MFKKTIGILGGMGPTASADTYMELTKMCQQKYGSVQDSDFPAVILYSLPLLDFNHEGFSNNTAQQESIITQLTSALKKLEETGAGVIIIDCNTVHYFLDDLQKSIDVPIINLISITVEDIIKNSYNRVAVLCSQTSKDVGLYTKPLEKAEIKVLNTSEGDQLFVNDAILGVMSGGITQTHIARLNSLIDKFVRDGAQSIILGCTEISNLAQRLNHNTRFIDSEKLAIEKALAFAK